MIFVIVEPCDVAVATACLTLLVNLCMPFECADVVDCACSCLCCCLIVGFCFCIVRHRLGSVNRSPTVRACRMPLWAMFNISPRRSRRSVSNDRRCCVAPNGYSEVIHSSPSPFARMSSQDRARMLHCHFVHHGHLLRQLCAPQAGCRCGNSDAFSFSELRSILVVGDMVRWLVRSHNQGNITRSNIAHRNDQNLLRNLLFLANVRFCSSLY